MVLNISLVRWIAFSLLALTLFVINIAVGSVDVAVADILMVLAGQDAVDPIIKNIILDFRLTKALTCVLAGSALSVSGLQMQTLFRNALAGPDVLGITSGASLIVSIAYMGGHSGLMSPWGVTISASLGCAMIFLIMLAFSRRLHDNVSLLIIGLMIGAGTSSIVSVLQFLSPADDLQMYMIWTFGSLGALNWNELQVLALVLVLGAAISLIMSKNLNAWLLGMNYAASLGIDLQRSRIFVILSASLLTGAVTAFCGPIAFVGLAVPHLVKMLFRTHNHLTLLPAVMLGGASLLLFCDTLAKVPSTGQVLPINAMTALIGAPAVIWIITRKRIVV